MHEIQHLSPFTTTAIHLFFVHLIISQHGGTLWCRLLLHLDTFRAKGVAARSRNPLEDHTKPVPKRRRHVVYCCTYSLPFELKCLADEIANIVWAKAGSEPNIPRQENQETAPGLWCKRQASWCSAVECFLHEMYIDSPTSFSIDRRSVATPRHRLPKKPGDASWWRKSLRASLRH